MGGLSPVRQHDLLPPVLYICGQHHPATAVTAEDTVPAKPRQSLASPELQSPEMVSMCDNPACKLLPTSGKPEQLSPKREGEAWSKIGTSIVEQPAFGKRKPLPFKQPPETIHETTPLSLNSTLRNTDMDGKEENEERGFTLQEGCLQMNHHSNPNAEDISTTIGYLRRRQNRSSQHSLSSSTSTSPESRISHIRSTLQKFPTAPARFRSLSVSCGRSESRPLLDAMHISAPSMASTTADPISRSRFQSWPGSYSPGRANPCPPKARKIGVTTGADVDDLGNQCSSRNDGLEIENLDGEDKSRWSSDSEDEEKERMIHLLWMPPRRPKNFRRRLSDWLCGS